MALPNISSSRYLPLTGDCTWDTAIRRLQIAHEVTLARVKIDQVADVDGAAGPCRALAVQVPQHVHLAADVEVAVDAASDTHPTVDGRRHQHCATCPTGGVERLVKAVIASLCTRTALCIG